MTRTLHPSELAQLIRNRFTARTAAIALLLMSLLLLAGGTRSQSIESRLLFFASSLGLGIFSRIVHAIAIDAERQFDDSIDISLTNWQNQLFKRTRDDKLTLEASPMSKEVERLPLFDWSELADSDQHPVLAVVAPMGGGKSRLVKYLGKYVLFDQQPSIVAFDIYARKQDWEQSATEYEDMLAVMLNDLDELSDRKLRYRNGEENFAPELRVMEEAVDTLPNIRAISQKANETVDAWLRSHVSVARKVRYRLCLVSVNLRGTDIGISSESRNDATTIFVGQKGVTKAMTDTRYFKLGTQQNADLKEQLRVSLIGIQRPALVYASGEWYPASVPTLNTIGDPIGFDVDEEEAELEDKTEIDHSVVLDAIEEAAKRLQQKEKNCTPGNVRLQIRTLKTASDEEIYNYFHILESQNRGNIDKSGKVWKFRINP